MNGDELHRIGDLLEQILSELREKQFMTVAEAAAYCAVTTRTIRSWREKGLVHPVMRGNRQGVMKSDLDRMIG